MTRNWEALETCLKAITIATRISAKGMKAKVPSRATGIASGAVAASGRPKSTAAKNEHQDAAEQRVHQREKHRPEDAVDRAVGADEEALDRAGDQFLADRHGITPSEMVRIWTITRPTTTKPK